MILLCEQEGQSMRARCVCRGETPSGFTLIELLIVIAIIAILALIAVPNFLEAQTRSKVSRVLADMRAIATGVEAYATDYGTYPHMAYLHAINHDQWDRDGIQFATNLTTPVAYLTTVEFRDPFCGPQQATDDGYLPGGTRSISIAYLNIDLYHDPNYPKHGTISASEKPFAHWALVSLAPDYVKGPDPTGIVSNWLLSSYSRPRSHLTPATAPAWRYDPSNGTYSHGDIIQWH